MSDKRLFLLDAYALIYRAYYGFIKNPRINSKGVNTSAIFGFVNTLEEVLRKENPSHIAVGFDPAGPTSDMKPMRNTSAAGRNARSNPPVGTHYQRDHSSL